mgnify:FL=1
MGLLQGPFERRDTPDTAKSMQATFDEFCTAKANQIELRPKKIYLHPNPARKSRRNGSAWRPPENR